MLYVSDKPGIAGGGEISLLLLIEGISESGCYEPLLAVPADGELARQAKQRGIKVVETPQPRLRSKPWLIPRLWRESGRLIERDRPSIVHLNNTRSMALVGIAAARRRIPVVWHVRVQGQDWLDRWLSRKCTLVLTPSRSVAERFAAEKVRVIPNPVAIPGVDRNSAEINALRASLVEGDAYLLIAVGELSPSKGYLRLLEALEKLSLDKAWHLLIAGGENPDDPGFRDHLDRLCHVKRWDDRVTFLGFREDITDLMLAADLLIHAPDFEGFGRVFIEAMSTGLPVVITPVGGLAELHQETGYGWMATDLTTDTLAEAIARALGDKVGRIRASVVGPETARSRFSVKAHVELVEAVYESLLSGNL